MNVRRGGLGRGLGALIPTAPAEGQIEGARFEELLLDSIEPNPRQPREVFDPEALTELVASIREVGILQPVVVREVEPGRFQLIMGERRWRAARQAGLELMPAIVRDTADDAMLRDALLENLHRQELNSLEEAAAYQQLLEEFGATHEELADRVGRSRSHVSNTLRLLNLSPTVQRRVAAGVLSAGHARALLALESPVDQEQLAARIVAEGLSVRAVEEIVTVGPTKQTARAVRTRRPVSPALGALAELLSEQFETRVTIDLGRRRGKLVVEFASLDDLERIITSIAPDAAGLLRGGAEAPVSVASPDNSGDFRSQHDMSHQTGQAEL
ncbi:MAG: ParB family transcriptional regulator, chromosome partitioning protein [Frankiaceae bacterium]|nr:ParB family transcriptional regulator, chromosome partitioning protein [Frankiaceae bacterium]